MAVTEKLLQVEVSATEPFGSKIQLTSPGALAEALGSNAPAVVDVVTSFCDATSPLLG